jgi:hypothetical protein
MSDRAEIEAHFLKAAAALLHAYNKAAAAFEKCDLFQHRLSTQNNREVTTNKAALSTKKPRSAPTVSVKVGHSG